MFLKNKLKRGSKTKTKDLMVVNKRTAFWKPLLLMLPAIIIILLFTVIPFIYTSIDGFHSRKNAWNALDTEWSLDTFQKVADDPIFHKAIKNSMLYAFISVPLIMIIAVVISSAIASVVRKRLRGAIQTIFFLPYITSAIAISLSFAYLLDWDTGLINKIIVATGGKKIHFTNDTQGSGALTSMLIYGVWRGLAFNILIFTTAMLGVDKTHYKAASIDGAGPVKQFFRITLPSINKTTNFLLTMGIIGSIKVFPLALFNNDAAMANQNGASTLMLYVFAQVDGGYMEKAGAASVILLAISIAFAFVVKGLINQMVRLANILGEKRVSNKIKG